MGLLAVFFSCAIFTISKFTHRCPKRIPVLFVYQLQWALLARTAASGMTKRIMKLLWWEVAMLDVKQL